MWRKRPDLLAGAAATDGGEDLARWYKLAETYVAVGVTRIMGRMCRLLRGELSIASLGSIGVVVALTSYPFQPRGNLTLAVAFVIMSIAAIAFWILLDMDRDEVLSAIAGSKPGEVSWDWGLVSRVLSFVVLPLLGLVASQPWSSAATSWLGQAIRMVLKTAE